VAAQKLPPTPSLVAYPPFSPLAAGDVIVSVPSMIVELHMTISGDVSSFGSLQQESLATRLKSTLACQLPSCRLELMITASSLAVTAVLIIPDQVNAEGGYSPAPVATVIIAMARALIAQPRLSLSAVLGVPVESVAPQLITMASSIPQVVAPPPAPPTPRSVLGAVIAGLSLGLGVIILATVWHCRSRLQRARLLLHQDGAASRKGEVQMVIPGQISILGSHEQQDVLPRRASPMKWFLLAVAKFRTASGKAKYAASTPSVRFPQAAAGALQVKEHKGALFGDV